MEALAIAARAIHHLRFLTIKLGQHFGDVISRIRCNENNTNAHLDSEGIHDPVGFVRLLSLCELERLKRHGY